MSTTMAWHAKIQVQAFTSFRAMPEYLIASQKIPVDIQFNFIVIIVIGLCEKVVQTEWRGVQASQDHLDHFVRSMSSGST